MSERDRIVPGTAQTGITPKNTVHIEAPAQPLKAALWMGGAIASFVFMTIAGRAIQIELNSFELMFWRSVIGFWIVIALIVTHPRFRNALPGQRWQIIRPTNPALHLTRNVFHFAGQNLWFYGIMMIPLSQLVAIEFTSPIWVALLSPLVLAERLTRRKLGAAMLGFAGVLLVAQPGLQPINSGHIAGMLAAVGFAMNIMLTKRIMRHDAVLCVLFWMTLLQALFGLILSTLGGFTWPSTEVVPWLFVVGITGLTAHFCLTTALSVAPATTVAPMEFARLPIIALVGVWVYAEALDPWVFAGAVIIFSANWINTRNSAPAR
ncbi:DMT family transporter [Roseicitreum antarcticum]|uniref:Permease of the drug/metabolite transporter (DMT) superfamily n=1 Tax=Roseicitreum antarcticum TaxID=564137 RepID=A0A1H2VT69_9RHOB|nr:DMT family transporter [Roseicitreum antarcticum]SDW71528.1 Permease of the drug/metabolite transporter (DMT) superfamily [Roseicitreum antarcticum]